MGKQIEVSDEAHKALKIESAESGEAMKHLVSNLIMEEYADE